METFRKIGNKSLNLPLKLEKIKNQYGVFMDNIFVGVRYYEVDESLEKKILKTFIHPQARKYFHVALMVINNSYIPPHIDNDLQIVMNYYVQTANATTYFWKPNQSTLSIVQVENQSDGKLFRESELECIGQFKAETNDLWMLDVSKIHSVGKIDNPNPTQNILRIAYCIQSNKIGFSEVIKNLDKIIL
jgi:hypothetical protein